VFPNVKRTLRDLFEMEAKVRAWCWVGCAGSGWVRSSNNDLDERHLRFLIQLQGTGKRFWMRPKEWGRSQSESVRKYPSPQKFLALKRSELHFPFRRCWSRRTQVAPTIKSGLVIASMIRILKSLLNKLSSQQRGTKNLIFGNRMRLN
jgi:hypothetical protein